MTHLLQYVQKFGVRYWLTVYAFWRIQSRTSETTLRKLFYSAAPRFQNVTDNSLLHFRGVFEPRSRGEQGVFRRGVVRILRR